MVSLHLLLLVLLLLSSSCVASLPFCLSGASGPPDAVVKLRSRDVTWIFQGPSWWSFDNVGMVMQDGYPRDIASYFGGGLSVVHAAGYLAGYLLLSDGISVWEVVDTDLPAAVPSMSFLSGMESICDRADGSSLVSDGVTFTQYTPGGVPTGSGSFGDFAFLPAICTNCPEPQACSDTFLGGNVMDFFVGNSAYTLDLGTGLMLPEGTLDVCRCPALSSPLNGNVACSNGVLESSVCTVTCVAEANLTGVPSSVCLPTERWSATAPQCRPIGGALSTALFPSGAEVPAYGFSVTSRDFNAAVVTSGWDVVQATVALVGQALTEVCAVAYSGAGVYGVICPVTSTAEHDVSVYVNGALAVQSRFSPAAGPVDLTATQIDASPLTARTLVTGESAVLLTVSPKDTWGNTRTNDVVTASVSNVVETLPADVTRKDGVHSISFTPTIGGTHTLSVATGGSLLPDAYTFVVNQACPAGKRVEGVKCVECEVNTYSAVENAVLCSRCPGASVTEKTGSSSLSACLCPANTYLAAEGCLPCPTGATCLGGSAPPSANAGFHSVADKAFVFVSCVNAAACLAGDQCKEGTEGYLCSECSPNFYRAGDQCLACSKTAATSSIALVIAFGVVLAGGLIWFNKLGESAHIAAAFFIGFDAFQTVAIIGSIAASWPPVAAGIFQALSLANFNLDLMAPECAITVPDAWFLKWGAIMALPVLLCAVVVIICAICTVYGHLVRSFGPRFATTHPHWVGAPGMIPRSVGERLRWRCGAVLVEAAPPEALRVASLRACYQLMSFCFMPLSMMVLRFWDCVTVDGVSVLRVNPRQQCFNGVHRNLIPADLVFVFLYCIGIPAFFFFMLRQKRMKLGPVSFFSRYGFLAERFNEKFYFGEVMMMVRKLLIVVIIVPFPDLSSKAAAALLLVLLSGFLFVGLKVYEYEYHNTMFAICFLATMAVLFGATPYPSETLRAFLATSGLLIIIIATVCGVVVDFFRMRRFRGEATKGFSEQSLSEERFGGPGIAPMKQMESDVLMEAELRFAVAQPIEENPDSGSGPTVPSPVDTTEPQPIQEDGIAALDLASDVLPDDPALQVSVPITEVPDTVETPSIIESPNRAGSQRLSPRAANPFGDAFLRLPAAADNLRIPRRKRMRNANKIDPGEDAPCVVVPLGSNSPENDAVRVVPLGGGPPPAS